MYEMEKLNYEYAALEPYVSEITMEIHYEEHYKAYVEGLNEILTSINYHFSDNLEDIIKEIDKFPENLRDDIFYNVGGVVNHNLFFKNISPNKNRKPSGRLKEKINQYFGSVSLFEEKFKEKANSLKGPGYTFLVVSSDGKLEIMNTHIQDAPYNHGCIPIMTLDLWEHACYLDYRNRRSDYIDIFFDIVDYLVVENIYEEIKQKSSKL